MTLVSVLLGLDLEVSCDIPHLAGLIMMLRYKQGFKYQIAESYRMAAFLIGYRISGEISGIRAHIGRSY